MVHGVDGSRHVEQRQKMKNNCIEHNKQLITIRVTGYQKAEAIYAGYPTKIILRTYEQEVTYPHYNTEKYKKK